MADKVKPLKIESASTGGTQNDPFPVEANPAQDYLAAKGIALENSDTRLIDLTGAGHIQFTDSIETTPVTVRQLRTATNNIFDNASNSFVATNVQEAIEEARNTATGISRFAITLTNNASMSNGQRFGYTELMPNAPVIIPRNCTLKEITFSNNSATTDAQFNIYSRTPATSPTPSGTLLYTWNLTNALTASLTGLSLSFTAGQECLVNYVDTGDNPSDAAMLLFFVNT